MPNKALVNTNIEVKNKALLKWQAELGADEAIADSPRNYFLVSTPSSPPVLSVRENADGEFLSAEQESSAARIKDFSEADSIKTPPAKNANILAHSPALAAENARELADKANSLSELEEMVRAFDGCALKKTAAKTVFADGNKQAKIMIIGEAPGAQEDIQGIPFCGPSGALLDKMLATIKSSRAENVYISNSVFWRPPGNRQPSIEETSICLPFVEKHIALIAPELLLLAGGVATLAILKRDESMSRLRGKIYHYHNKYLKKPLPTLVTYHPSYLLRQPSQKRLAWQDMLLIEEFIEKNSEKNNKNNNKKF